MATPDVLSLLTQVLDRLGKIERKIGVASSGGDGGDERAAAAVDYEASIINGPAKALIEAAAKIPADGEKLVRRSRGSVAGAAGRADARGEESEWRALRLLRARFARGTSPQAPDLARFAER
jgi:hypothetical protein